MLRIGILNALTVVKICSVIVMGIPLRRKTNSGSSQRRVRKQEKMERYPVTLRCIMACEATVALRFLFGRGNSVESESLELELESAKTFARHMLLGE